MPTINRKIDCTCPECDNTFIDEVDLTFDVYCGECGAGICNFSNYDNRRDKLDVRCPHCFKAFEDNITDLEDQIKKLENELDRLTIINQEEIK